MGYIFAAIVHVGLSCTLVVVGLVASQKCEVAQNSEKIGTYSSSRSSKVIDFGTNRKRICDFLLVLHSNSGPVLHRFWDTATYWPKIAYFSYPSLIRNIACEVNHDETRIMGIFYGESYIILTSTVF